MCISVLVTATVRVNISARFTFLCFRLTQDPKSGNWRVFLNDGKVSRPMPDSSRASTSDRSSGVDSCHSTRLSTVLKHKSPTSTNESALKVLDRCHSHSDTMYI